MGINVDKYHPGFFGKVGMRHFCWRKNGYWCPKTNVEALWSLVSENARTYCYQKNSNPDKAAVIDCTKAGIFKVLGRGELPKIPVIVKARFFSKEAEKKINAAGGVCVATA